jgi:conjugative relaxase-like TrwC/TraI family protein
VARQAGDVAGEGYWSGLVAEVDAMIRQAVRAGFDYFRREAGYTRTGSHNTRVNGRETGQWHKADLAVAHWLQHTSRDGDMQLHVHSQIAHVARTGIDGKWQAPDSLGYNEHVGAVAAIVSQHLEEALTARFGLAWEARDDGHGFEIKGVSGEMMRLFSSRRESITADISCRAARFVEQYGRAPSQRELARLAQASNFATRAAKTGTLDLAQAHAGWADTLARSLGVSLASVAPSVWHDPGAGRAVACPRSPRGPGPHPGQVELSRAAQKAGALAQQDKSTWTRADVIKYLGRVLPRSGMDPAAAAALLEEVADRALTSEFEPVACLEAPEPVQLPASLLRADGRSVHRRHGGMRYATHAQLSMEQRMVALARASDAPRMNRAEAARALGADLAQLERMLDGGAPDAQEPRTRIRLRMDQAAAAWSVLTDGKRVSVINAPAGSGKTWVLAAAGRAWAAAGLGRVIGITPSQSARNTLAAQVPESYNTAQFLGHLPGRRGARGPIPVRPGDLVLMDEASMAANPDLADVIAQAAGSGAKVILAGDTQQLQAVENGGGLSLLADALGFVQLAEPVRFRAGWEQAASLRLRNGDATVLAEYDQHARIRGGEPEQMMDAAAADYLALTLDGTDVLLMAAPIGERDLAGARDLAAVIDARIRYRTGPVVLAPIGSWSDQVPAIADPDHRVYLTGIAALMDARKDRIGEHAAEHALPWAVAALGPVPADPMDRLDWQKRAASIGAWRELSGHRDPADPIGPEPVATAPELRAAWYEALAALGPVDGPDVRGMPYGRLLHLRDTYPIETAWAPQYVGDELRQVRAAAREARLSSLRASAEAAAAANRGHPSTAARQQELAASYHALHQAYRQRETVFVTIMADRADWDAATRAQRHQAVAADAELRRRHPDQHYLPLRSAEPEPATESQRAELTLTPGQPPGEMGQWVKELAAAHRTFAERLANLQGLTIPSQDPGYGDLGQAFPPWPGRARDAILQPPKPEIRPAPQVVERTPDRDVDWEAAD